MEHVIHLNSFLGKISKDRKRVGRGVGSGRGGTSGAGHKGQSARSGTSSKRRNAEFARRFPKVGFKSNKPDLAVITLHKLSQIAESRGIDTISLSDLKITTGLKIIGTIESMKPIKVQATKISKGAQECIDKFGGSVEIIKKFNGSTASTAGSR